MVAKVWRSNRDVRRVALGGAVVATAALLAACGGGGSGGSGLDGEPMELTILHINDHHSTLESRSKTLQLSAGGAAPVAVAVDAGGFPRVTAAIEELSKRSPNVLKQIGRAHV